MSTAAHPAGADFGGSTVIVTGAAGGIGAGIAAALARAGATVAAVDIAAALATTTARLRHRGLAVHAHPADVRDAEAVDGVVAQVEATLGAVEVLVNAAGVLRPGRLTDLDDADWEEQLAVNAGGVARVSRAVARWMIPRGRGAIITVASNAATVPRVDMGAYAASKAAAVQLTRCLGLELAPHGIRCNVVSPGSTDTPMLRAAHPDGDGLRAAVAGRPEEHRVGIPTGRVATVEDVAASVVFLASPAAGQITLQHLRVDGGAALGA